MSIEKKIQTRRTRRIFRVRNKLKDKSMRPRVTVYRSLKHIYAQVIDDVAQVTIASFSSKHLPSQKGEKKEIAKSVGAELGKILLSKSITNVYFDRGSYKYHGRVASLADGLRESGLQF